MHFVKGTCPIETKLGRTRLSPVKFTNVLYHKTYSVTVIGVCGGYN